MKRLFVFSFLFILFSSINTFAQGMLNNGAAVYMANGATIYIAGATGNYTNQSGGQIIAGPTDNIALEGNWVNNASNPVFTTNGGIVSMVGGSQTLGGTNSTSFNSLSLSGTGTKTLASDILVGGGYSSPSGNLNINDRPLDLNGHTLTISNPAAGNATTGAIQYTTGYIISEQNAATNNNIIKWQMGGSGNVGYHIFPFGTTGGTQIPLTFSITSTANTTVSASTRRTIDNSCAPAVAGSCNKPWAMGVTNMNDITGTDISESSVIDRWWQINVSAPTTADLTLTYQGVENTTTNPTGSFVAQEWNSSNSLWFGPMGGATGVTLGVGVASVPSVNAFGSIVLTESASELPISLVSFESSCLTKGTELSWATATEQNVNYFTVERSFDGENFTGIAQIKAVGNSASVNNYSYLDNTDYSTTAYYRLSETDMTNNVSHFQIITSDCHNTIAPFAVAIYPNPNQGNYLNVHLSGLAANANVQLNLVDILGRQLMPSTNAVADGTGVLISGIDLNHNLPKGIYNIVIQSGGMLTTKSFVVQ